MSRNIFEEFLKFKSSDDPTDYYFEEFLNFNSSDDPRDYYFVLDKKGTKRYFSRITGKQVAKNIIKKEILSKIEIYALPVDKGRLIDKKRFLEEKIKDLQKELYKINEQLNQPDIDPQEEFRKEELKNKEARERHAKRKKQSEKFFDSFFNKKRKTEQSSNKKEQTKQEQYGSHQQQNKKTEKGKDEPAKKSYFQQYNITTKKEWYAWLKRNHPDKNTQVDLDICQKVIAEGKARGW